MNSRPNTYISKDVAELIAKLAEDDLIRRGDAEAIALLGGSPADMIARIRAIPADTQLSTLREELNQTLSDMRFHVEDAVKAWNQYEAKELELAHAELLIQTLQNQLSNANSASNNLSSHIHDSMTKQNILIDDIKLLYDELKEAHSMLLWCERRMMSPSLAEYPRREAERIAQLLR